MATYVVEWTGKSKEFSGSGDKANYINAQQFADKLNVPAGVLDSDNARRESWGGNALWDDYTRGRK